MVSELPEPLTGPWRLRDLPPPADDAPTVFSCFHCGGGSTMGYKLAGCRVLGGVEIDPAMMAVYRANHHPKHSYLMGVGDFVKIPDADLPAELFDLDILDGSPPCSSFSTNGARDKKWGKKAHFREGQAKQVLDDLFFDFIDVAEKLKPRVVVAENVRGLIVGKARGYVKAIFRRFKAAGYRCQLFLLNASRMGVPQARERTFFVATREPLPRLSLSFGEALTSASEAMSGAPLIATGKPITGARLPVWRRTRPGKSLGTQHPKGHWFSRVKLDPLSPAMTVTAAAAGDMLHWSEPRSIHGGEALRLQTFPDDYNFGTQKPHYMVGMSVPPFMMQRVALEIRRQWRM